MTPALFVAGTGTNIGKTFVSCGLLRAMPGLRALKPIVSGFDPDEAAESDPAHLLTASGISPTPAAIAQISPWRFQAPLSPDQAAARERRQIDFQALLAFCRNTAKSGPLLVEGVGGVMVPLTESETTLDWIAQLGWPVLLVTGGYLGTLSHTLTALDALAHRGIPVAALVVNARDAGHVPVEDTIATLHRFASTTLIFALPANPDDADFAALAKHVAVLRPPSKPKQLIC